MNEETLKNLTILYVEDDDATRQNAVEYLRRLCLEVYEARDGKEALVLWRDNKPDVIIADVSMPRMNGLDMARYIRAEDKEVKIIIASAHTDTDYLLEAVELQLIKYLVKPLTKAKLLGALEESAIQIENAHKFMVRLADDCVYNGYTQEVIFDDEKKKVRLTKNEKLFVDLLSRNKQRVVNYEEIEDVIWPIDGMSQDAIRSLVRALRKKLPDDAIENISGVGYKINTLD